MGKKRLALISFGNGGKLPNWFPDLDGASPGNHLLFLNKKKLFSPMRDKSLF
jgi:hypothetical protein